MQVVTLGEIPFVNVEKMPADGICKRLNAKSNSFPCYNFTSGKLSPFSLNRAAVFSFCMYEVDVVVQH